MVEETTVDDFAVLTTNDKPREAARSSLVLAAPDHPAESMPRTPGLQPWIGNRPSSPTVSICTQKCTQTASCGNYG